MIYIHEKDIFGKLFRGFSLDISEEIIDKDFLISNRINSLVVRRSVNQEKEDLTMLSENTSLRRAFFSRYILSYS